MIVFVSFCFVFSCEHSFHDLHCNYDLRFGRFHQSKVNQTPSALIMQSITTAIKQNQATQTDSCL